MAKSAAAGGYGISCQQRLKISGVKKWPESLSS
jgi:hypothetical protein